MNGILSDVIGDNERLMQLCRRAEDLIERLVVPQDCDAEPAVSAWLADWRTRDAE